MRSLISYPFPVFLAVLYGGVALTVGLIAMPFTRMNSRAEIKKFQSIQQTFNKARANKSINPLEMAAIQQKAVAENAELAEIQYWNQTIFDWWIDDGVMELKPIE